MENKLPKYWVVKRDPSNPNWEKVIEYLNEQFGYHLGGDCYNYYGTEPSTGSGLNFYDSLDSFRGNPTLLTIETFMELTNEKLETMVKIERKQLEVIYDIACSDWKLKIENIAREQLFGDEIELTESQVDEMFKAATKDQFPILLGIFGKQREELDFRVALDVKVDGLSLFGGLETSHTEAFIVLPSPYCQVHRNRFYLNPNYNWELVDDELIVTRK